MRVLYPDVAAAGDLRTALQRRCDAAGGSVPVRRPSAPGWAEVGADVRVGDRQANVLMALYERFFLLEFYLRGVVVGRGNTSDLDEAAAAVSAFASGVGVRQLSAVCPFVRVGGFAEAFEAGEPEAIAYRWRRFLDVPSHRARHLIGLHDFLTAAADEPRLRSLYPFTSHRDLGFRRLVRQDVPSPALAWVRPFGDGRYLVAGADRRQLPSAGPSAARESVALVLAALDRDANP